MNNKVKDLYSQILKYEREVHFWHAYHFYVIYNSNDIGFNIDIYTNKDGLFSPSDPDKMVFVKSYRCSSTVSIEAIDYAIGILNLDPWVENNVGGIKYV